MENLLVLPLGLALLAILMIFWFVTRYKRCPSDKILVIYGRTGRGSAKCIAGGAAFVWPVIQDYQYLDLTPISIDVDLQGALSKQNIRVSVPSRFTVGISNNEGLMTNAAERLLGRSSEEIRELAKDIIFGQLRLVVATMDIEEINADRDKFLANVSTNVGSELSKIGLELINVNVTDIQDESGYIEALGKEAAAQAINEAKVRVAEKDREGSIGEARAQREQRIEVAKAEAEAQSGEARARQQQRIEIAEADAMAVAGEAEAGRNQRISVSEAEAEAIKGENLAKISIAETDSERRIKEAEAQKRATAAEKIQSAQARQQAYEAEKLAELARAAREKATKEADIIVKAEIAKREAEIAAEAEAEQIRRKARGQADAIFMKREATAKGIYEMLTKQAQGFDQIVKSAGGDAREAVLMMIADKLEDLVKTQVDAIKNIKIDKVTVWEGGNNEGEGNSTSKFVSGLYKSVPPLNDLFNMAGMNLPNYLGEADSVTEEAEEVPDNESSEETQR